MTPSPQATPNPISPASDTNDPWARAFDQTLDRSSKLDLVSQLTGQRRRQRRGFVWIALAALMTTAVTGCVWT